jgi:hypothetical protein
LNSSLSVHMVLTESKTSTNIERPGSGIYISSTSHHSQGCHATDRGDKNGQEHGELRVKNPNDRHSTNERGY